MAAVTAVVLPRLRPGDVLVAPRDGYPGIRKLAASNSSRAASRCGSCRPTPTRSSRPPPGATLVLGRDAVATRGLDVADLDAVAAAAHAAGALLAVDNTLATPLGQRPLDHGADFAMVSGTKALTGHGDVLLGAVSVRDPALAAELRAWRSHTGAILGPFEAWLAHRSLATLGLRLERSQANARALVEALAARDDVTGVRWPGVGPGRGDRSVISRTRRGVPGRMHAGQPGDKLRRRALDRRAPRALGDRRRARGLHPLLGGCEDTAIWSRRVCVHWTRSAEEVNCRCVGNACGRAR